MPAANPLFPPPALCGCFVVVAQQQRRYLPLVTLVAHAQVLSHSSRTTLTQTFVNPAGAAEVRYDFPLYDGVSVVGLVCTVGDRVVRGVVRERGAARAAYLDARARGDVAALLQQDLRASDVFSTTLGNVPAGQEVTVEVTYLGELEHDAEADGMLRFTIPTAIAPRYGRDQTVAASHRLSVAGGKIAITVDAEMPAGCSISKIQSPSHPISVSLGNPSAREPMSLQRASASLALGSSELGKDFVVQVVAAGLGNPAAMLETHPTIPNQRALMATLVPKFNLPAERPEVVFVCDRSGSMGVGRKMPNLVAALHVFLKSLPVGARFNICSFGSRHSFLWDRSQLYGQESLDEAVQHVESFAANYGGTEMYQPLEETFKRRCADVNLDVILLTDGEIWDQNELIAMVNDHVAASQGSIRVFTLGVGEEASSALIQGVARAGNGFAQKVAQDEKMDKKVVRMLKGALSPHVKDYALEIKYAKTAEAECAGDDDFEVIERLTDLPSVDVEEGYDEVEHAEADDGKAEPAQEPISLFKPDAENDEDDELEVPDATTPSMDTKPGHLPTVTPPRFLQTPFTIPPLFLYNRTTVYVIMSDSTPKHEPTSVVLTATCAHGPLRLEIPVTTLAEKGMTIHQLAARKAMQELEEDRGWIAHATDGKGALLKREFKDQFHNMVRREGVRLGVEYQVAGKWCSFVAVEERRGQGDAGEKQEKILGDIEVVRANEPSARSMMFGSGAASPVVRCMASPVVAFGQAAPMTVSSGFGSLDDSGEGMAFAAFGGPSTGSTGFGGAPTAPAMFGQASSGSPRFRGAPRMSSWSRGGSRGGGRMRASLFGGGPTEAWSFDDAVSGSDGGEMDTEVAPDDALAVLASLQTFIGSWTWSEALERVTGVTRQRAADVLRLPDTGDTQADVAATLCAVVFLRKRLCGEKEAWELMVGKAEGWLEAQTGAEAAELERIVEEAGLFDGR